jgi:hypothetical protein
VILSRVILSGMVFSGVILSGGDISSEVLRGGFRLGSRFRSRLRTGRSGKGIHPGGAPSPAAAAPAFLQAAAATTAPSFGAFPPAL